MTSDAKSRSGETGKLSLQRIRVKADGYDSTGAYWGAGPDVYIATTPDGATEVTVRAKSVADAHDKVAAELARAPGEARAGPRDRLGGAAPTKSRYEIKWHDPVTEKTLTIRVTHSRDYLGQGQDHIEVESLEPPAHGSGQAAKAALPISETGYRSHFISPLELMNDGGPVTFVTAWLEREAKSKDWQKQVARRQQGDLFQWADAQGQVTKRGSVKKKSAPNTPTAKQRPAPAKRPKPA